MLSDGCTDQPLGATKPNVASCREISAHRFFGTKVFDLAVTVLEQEILHLRGSEQAQERLPRLVREPLNGHVQLNGTILESRLWQVVSEHISSRCNARATAVSTAVRLGLRRL